MTERTIRDIIDATGIPVGRYEQVSGGDINFAWCLHSNGEKYFLKVNDADPYPNMFRKETTGLNAIRQCFTGIVPAVISNGEVNGRQYLVMEWLERSQPQRNFWEVFGTAIAQMHRTPQPWHGWEEDNYVGSLAQDNAKHSQWPDFYAECRIMPLVRKLADAALFTAKDVKAAGQLCSKLANLFPKEPPALLHGDLWSGNYMATENGPAVYDPAVYAGHREMDIAMTLLFGGFDQRFYDAYNSSYPLAAGWQERVALAQLYPLLVHAVLFGDHYINSVRSIISRYI